VIADGMALKQLHHLGACCTGTQPFDGIINGGDHFERGVCRTQGKKTDQPSAC
jgi:hypothetical protein